jgi:hypothetical protein
MITNSIIIAFFIYLIIKHVFYGNTIIEGVESTSDTSNAARIHTIAVTQESHTQQIKKLTDKYKTLQGLLNDNRIKTAIQTNAANSTLANKLKACAKKK